MSEQNETDPDKLRHLNVKDIVVQNGDEKFSPLSDLLAKIEKMRASNPGLIAIDQLNADQPGYKRVDVVFIDKLKKD